MTAYYIDADFSHPPAYQSFVDQSPMISPHAAHYTGAAEYSAGAQPYYYPQADASAIYPNFYYSYDTNGSGYDAATYSFHDQGVDSASYIHAPTPTHPAQNTILHSGHTASISETPPFHQHPSSFTDAGQSYSQAETTLPENGMASSTCTTSKSEEALATHARDASSLVHEHSGDPRIQSNRKKSALKPSEIRRRRADRRRAKVQDIASALPFQATDPESLSTHEKKRLFVSGLEEYSIWLEEQFRLVGKKPAPMLKVKGYKGINSRSLRTMIAHFQNEAHKLHAAVQREERKFHELEAQVIELES